MVLAWFVLVGGVLVAMALASRWVARMPLSYSAVYLLVGAAIGPGGVALIEVDLVRHARVVEVLSEVAVLISLLAVGLRLQLPLNWRHWRAPLTLATVTMSVTIVGVALAAHFVLGLDWPVALLLGAILAPTDPVLASDVQLRHPGDRDALRVALTAEGGLNDGTAFPAVMLALVLIAAAADPVHWLVHDVAWAITGAVALGGACGLVTARAVAWLRSRHGDVEHEEFLALGLIAATYGIALAIATYGFIAVFVAGLAFAHAERAAVDARPPEPPAPTAHRLLVFTTQVERLAEVALVLLIGAALWTARLAWPLLLFAALVIVVVRPLSVLMTIPRQTFGSKRRWLLAWFGIRGIGSVYYASYAINHAEAAPWMAPLASAVLTTIAASIVVHGMSATPMMQWRRR